MKKPRFISNSRPFIRVVFPIRHAVKSYTYVFTVSPRYFEFFFTRNLVGIFFLKIITILFKLQTHKIENLFKTVASTKILLKNTTFLDFSSRSVESLLNLRFHVIQCVFLNLHDLFTP